jgi:hypothetical protein
LGFNNFKIARFVAIALNVILMNDDTEEVKQGGEEKASYSISPLTLAVSTITSTYDYKEQRKLIKNWAKSELVGNSYYVPTLGYEVTISMAGIKKALSQTHSNPKVRDEIIKNIVPELTAAVKVAESIDSKGKPGFYFYYLECSGGAPPNYIVLRKTLSDGVVSFYCIVEKIKK